MRRKPLSVSCARAAALRSVGLAWAGAGILSRLQHVGRLAGGKSGGGYAMRAIEPAAGDKELNRPERRKEEWSKLS